MARIAINKKFDKARNGKNDEFFTVLSDIEREVRKYYM